MIAARRCRAGSGVLSAKIADGRSRTKERARDELAVALIGPAIDGRAPGGIASASAQIARSSVVAERCHIYPVSNWREGPLWTRVGAAIAGCVALWRLRRVVDLGHIQLATGLSVEQSAVTAVVARLLGLPFVVQFHGAGQIEDYEGGSRVHRHALAFLVKRSEASLALGTQTAAWLAATFPNAVVEIVPNWTLGSQRKITELSKDPTILFVGRLGSRKGGADLLAAIKMLSGEGIHPKVVLAGDGDVAAFSQTVSSDAAFKQVELLGWRSADEVASLMQRSWVTVLPSYAEGLPMAILESMTAGRAVIATDVGNVRDAVEDGVSGILLAPGDVKGLAEAIARIVGDKQTAAEMGRAAYVHAKEHYSEEAVAKKLTRVYTRVGDRSRQRVQVIA